MLYFTYPLAGLLILVLAIGTGVVLTRKFNLSWRLYAVGAAAFIASQIFHIPFNAWLLQPLAQQVVSPALSRTQSLLISAALLGLSAGLFEEAARYIAYRWWVKDARSWARGLLL
ncbi:MAG TPA: YhfC family glutamic-type intramembrane protease, partial [Anaerolineales bacterium]|nr:YhfC family glutamic-type intramembrane protease [Anaerolineales bacterium]